MLCHSLRCAPLALSLAMPSTLPGQATWTQIAGMRCTTAGFRGDVVELLGVTVFQVNNELWRTDGTQAGTFALAPNPVPFFRLQPPVRMGGELFFANQDPATGEELWATDGTVAGTRRVRDTLPGVTSLLPRSLTAGPGFVIFTGQTPPTGGIEPYVSDGTFGGTFLLADLYPGALGSNPSGFTRVGDEVVFLANDGTHGTEFWATDGTRSGTRLVTDFVAGAGSLNGAVAGSDGERLYFRRGTQANAWLIATDGTAAGTVQLGAWSGTLTSVPLRGFVRVGGRTWFTVAFRQSGGGPVQLWSTDGTAMGTVSHGEIVPAGSSTSSEGPRLWALGDKLLYERTTLFEGTEPWLLDPATGVTWIVQDFALGVPSSRVEALARLDSGANLLHVVFNASGSLWDIDPVGVAPPTLIRANVDLVEPVGSRHVWLASLDGPRGIELFRSDGTAPGTVVAGGETHVGSDGLRVEGMSVVGGRLVVFGQRSISPSAYVCGPEVWAVEPGAYSRAIGDAGAYGVGRGALEATDPVLGATMAVAMRDLGPGSIFAVVVDAPAAAPTPLGAFWAYSSLTAPETLAAGALVSGSASLALPVPNDPALTGLEVVAQAFGLGATELRATNGVSLVLGR